MPRANDGEVPAVEGYDRRDNEPLGQGNHAGVGSSEGQVVLALDELGAPDHVEVRDVGELEGANGY